MRIGVHSLTGKLRFEAETVFTSRVRSGRGPAEVPPMANTKVKGFRKQGRWKTMIDDGKALGCRLGWMAVHSLVTADRRKTATCTTLLQTRIYCDAAPPTTDETNPIAICFTRPRGSTIRGLERSIWWIYVVRGGEVRKENREVGLWSTVLRKGGPSHFLFSFSFLFSRCEVGTILIFLFLSVISFLWSQIPSI